MATSAYQNMRGIVASAKAAVTSKMKSIMARHHQQAAGLYRISLKNQRGALMAAATARRYRKARISGGGSVICSQRQHHQRGESAGGAGALAKAQWRNISIMASMACENEK